MRITIYGMGYVGLVTAACLASLGHLVLGIDTNAERIHDLQQGREPFYEPGLETLLQQQANRLRFSTSLADGVAYSEVQMIAVGTPSHADGSADLTAVNDVVIAIAKLATEHRLIVIKSTVPMGTGARLRAMLDNRGTSNPPSFAANPEFLREGIAIQDFLQPDRIVLGVSDPSSEQTLKEIYAAYADCLVVMDIPSAELTKYTANALLATKISFINEMSRFAEAGGANIEHVRLGIAGDHRIGPHFLKAGCGFGGSCFPKDLSALLASAAELNLSAPLLTAVHSVNAEQKQRLVEKAKQHFKEKIAQKTVAIWGLAFKPNTDDVRDAPSMTVIHALQTLGVKVQAYDPVAQKNAANLMPQSSQLRYSASAYEVLEGADALFVLTEWPEFLTIEPQSIVDHLNSPVIFDGRNLWEPSLMQSLGITYYSVGR